MSIKQWEVKTWPEFWEAISNGRKNFDVRKGDDRDYQPGDILILKEFDPRCKHYTGRQTQRKIGYVMHGGPWLPDDVWVLGFAE